MATFSSQLVEDDDEEWFTQSTKEQELGHLDSPRTANTPSRAFKSSLKVVNSHLNISDISYKNWKRNK